MSIQPLELALRGGLRDLVWRSGTGSMEYKSARVFYL